MDFSPNRPIYLQIADYACAAIVHGQWIPEQRIPSVRELAAELGVNTHTVLRALDELQSRDIIAPRRGMGYYLTPHARASVDTMLRDEFFNDTLPALAERMRQLGITPDELAERLKDIM